jgi:general secretion pathway protein C
MKAKLPAKQISIYVLLAFVGFVIADLAILFSRDQFLPLKPSEGTRPLQNTTTSLSASFYAPISSRNIFNADGKVPPAIGEAEKNKEIPDGPPVPSSLPIQLVGTIVHVNPLRSVATINMRSKNEQVPVKVNDAMPDNLGTITKIERHKVTFRASSSMRLEYIEMKDDSRISFGTSSPNRVVGEVLQKSDTEFELKRDDVNRLLGNTNNLLQQARALPKFGPGGILKCFDLVDIMPGSIFERLGLRRGDCIKSVNGENITDVAKAQQLFENLKGSASNINLGIERSGRDEMMNYNITQ